MTPSTVFWIILLLGTSIHLSLSETHRVTFRCLANKLLQNQNVCPAITVQYTVKNELVEPLWEISTNVTSELFDPFMKFMEKAADADERFKFSLKYDGQNGYIVQEVNGVMADFYGKWRLFAGQREISTARVEKYRPLTRNMHHILKYSL